MKDSNPLIKDIGEVSSIVGYYKQYEICALEIYDALLNNQLEGVEFASKELKKLDDILIICKEYDIKGQFGAGHGNADAGFDSKDFLRSGAYKEINANICFNNQSFNIFPVGPNRSVLIISVGNPISTSVLATFSTNKVGPQMKQFGCPLVKVNTWASISLLILIL